MRYKNFGKFLALATLFASLFLVSIQPADAVEEYTWYGYITEKYTGNAVSDLTVELWFEEAFSGTKYCADTTTTNSEGYYCVTGTLDESEPGYWTAFLKLMKDGYITVYVECGHVPLSDSTGRFDYTEMEQESFYCSFHGYVKNKFTGAKVGGARVRLKNSDGTILASTYTNSNGYYSLVDICCEGGKSYYLQASKIGLYSDWKVTIAYPDGNIYNLIYLEEGFVR